MRGSIIVHVTVEISDGLIPILLIPIPKSLTADGKVLKVYKQEPIEKFEPFLYMFSKPFVAVPTWKLLRTYTNYLNEDKKYKEVDSINRKVFYA